MTKRYLIEVLTEKGWEISKEPDDFDDAIEEFGIIAVTGYEVRLTAENVRRPSLVLV